MIGIGVVGYGYWGPNLVRNFMETSSATVISVCDQDQDKLDLVQKRYPTIIPTLNFTDLLSNPAVDAIVIATPVRSHYELALQALKADKHVLIEKPMAETSEQTAHLVAEAEQRGLTLMVDHTFIYTGAVRKLKELVETGELGKINYYDSSRINLGLFQHDVDVIWDLAVHDISILGFVLGEFPNRVSATGASHVPGMVENTAYITLFYESGTIAHVNVNWLSPVKMRSTVVGGDKKMVVYDDLEPSEKIKIYDKGVTVTDDPEQIYQMRVGYRTGDMLAPNVPSTEALLVEAEHFVDCIVTKKTPITSGKMGHEVVKIVEAATASMKQFGQPVSLLP